MSPQSIGGHQQGIFPYVQNAADTFNKAISADVKPRMPLMDAFWGDRFGSIVDPFGHDGALQLTKKT